jgi:hypothetical protein
MDIKLDESNNEPGIVCAALRNYLRHLYKEAGPGGWQEINAEIATVKKLIQYIGH